MEALGDAVPHMTFFPAVMIAAYFGGLGPGLLATILSAVAANYFLGVDPFLKAVSAAAPRIPSRTTHMCNSTICCPSAPSKLNEGNGI